MKIDFTNTKVAFQRKSTGQLLLAKWLFASFAYPGFVRFIKRFTLWCFKVKLPIGWAIKHTVFEHFCGGETIHECARQIDIMHKNGVGASLDYSVEDIVYDLDFDLTKDKLIQTINFAKNNPGVPFAVFKPSAIGRNALYEKVSKKETLSEKEQNEWQLVLNRWNEIGEAAQNANTPTMVDAEEVRTQIAVDELATELMRKYNKTRALIYNTVQLYRWDRLDYVKQAVAQAREEGYFYGVKIVRGAYMEHERLEAENQGYPDPIQPTKKATDTDYDNATRFLFENIDIVSMVVATHNEASCQLVVDLKEKYAIAPADERVYLAQLHGMSDNLSYNLAAHGHLVLKYLPFGPIKSVMPYLFRRAEENTSMEGQTSRELLLIKNELKRRKSA